MNTIIYNQDIKLPFKMFGWANIPSLKLILAVYLCFLSATTQNQGQIMIDYEGSTKVADLVRNEQGKFYVDVGAYDPVFLSNTLELEMAGWKGINLEANHVRNSRFYVLRPGQINLNAAVGESSKFVQLFNLKRSELSTTNPDEEEKKGFVDMMTVPSISLKELCERYYKSRPTLINIGFQDDADKVLQGNNWALIKCVPDIFVVANRKHIPDTTVTKYRQRLIQKQYKKFDELEWSDAEVYVKETLMDKYRKNYLVSQDQAKGKQVIKFSQILNEFSTLLNKKISSSATENQVGLYFAKKYEAIDVMDLLKETEKVVMANPDREDEEQNPPTVVLNFRLKQNSLIVSNCSFSIQKIVDQKIEILNLTILAPRMSQRRTSIYILDYKQSPENIVPKIVVLNEICTQSGTNFVAASNQVSTPQQLSLTDYIIEIVFSVTFLILFLSFSVLLFIYLYQSLQNERRIQNHRNVSVNQQSELSTIN